jgi:hypothetical protein
VGAIRANRGRGVRIGRNPPTPFRPSHSFDVPTLGEAEAPYGLIVG